MRRAAGVEVWGEFSALPAISPHYALKRHELKRRRLGSATTIRGVRAIARRNPSVRRLFLKGTADALDRTNGLSMTWAKDVDLIVRYVPVDYEIIKEGAA
jgi:hypothetical protein